MDTHSTYVAWAKTLLPLAALVLLSTMFLFARSPRVSDADIPFADLEALAREQQVSAPAFSGVADDGSIIEIEADSARPEGEGTEAMSVSRIRGTVTSPGGPLLELRAGEGYIDTDAGTARLSGLARIETSNGYEVETSALTADLESGRIETDGPLEAHAPFGELTAGRLTVETSEEGGQSMVFQEGVRLLYRPPTQEGAPE
ncbi:hypothetical protein [Histidinibacterium aquaticum]|uniref:Lipopolysaccharide export system protein LptC n=1 Tax=Histidinibacterium aquaticum TaxID=2613962 RepID=A0A5J5GGS5_9RHOB|nr:hypothetical protein [Histidinibacterium aquaticum]KAA9006938.1 hypothetical protein F3S47_14305 [Histidinibacterium aquaticum]